MTDLRPYQLQAIQDIERAIDDAQAPLYVLPTGAGKTVVAAQIIERAIASCLHGRQSKSVYSGKWPVADSGRRRARII
jgi:ERCC4-related helicase